MPAKFTDSINTNLQMIQDILTEIPPHAQQKVRKIAAQFVNLCDKVRKDHPNDVTAALAVAFAAYYMANHMTESSQNGDDKQLIQLLS